MVKNKKNNSRLVVLLDVHAILHRAYHAVPNFSSSRGDSTGALYGLCTMLIKTIKDFNPDHILACFDLPQPTYRHQAYDDYKSGRAKTDDALIEQIKRADDVFKAFSIPVYKVAGFEADDLLGTLVERGREHQNLNFIIASGDMDTLQLVDGDRVRVFTLKKGIRETVLYNEQAVRERFGFGPELLPDYKGLSGDPSDNIIGIKGIGDKTATKLIELLGDLDNVLSVAVEDPDRLRQSGIKDRVINLLVEGQEEAVFSKMLATIRRDVPIDLDLPKTKTVFDLKKIEGLFDQLEFRSLIPRAREVLATDGDPGPNDEQELKNEGVLTDQELAELKVGAWLLDSNRTDPSLDDILQVAGTNDIKKAQNNIFKRLKAEGMWDLYQKIERPLVIIVEAMTKAGISIDKKNLSVLRRGFEKKLRSLEKDIFGLVGKEFNINSTKQLAVVLFDDLSLSAPNLKKTPKGARSTKESELEKLKDVHPVVSKVLDHRQLSKLVNTYLDPIDQLIGQDGRLHARFVQSGTTTGRMASTDPNLQNIPIRSQAGRDIRSIFTARPGFSLAAFDYSQIELRIAALLSGDHRLIEIFTSHGDVHQGVAAKVFNVEPSAVTKEMRRQAKVINFGIIYGMGVNALKANLGTNLTEARRFLQTYFEQFPELYSYLEGVKKEAAANGFTTTFFGRRRYFAGFQSNQSYIVASAERMAINAPIQGTEADIIKKAMVDVDGFLKNKGWSKDVALLLQVHDELVYEVKTSKIKTVLSAIIDLMEQAVPKEFRDQIPFPVEIEWGHNWRDLESFSK